MIFEDESVENSLNDGFMSDDSLEDENVSDTEMETMVPEAVRHQLEDSVRRDEEEISDQERVESEFSVDDTGDNEPEQSDNEMADDVTRGRSRVRVQRGMRAARQSRARSRGGRGRGRGRGVSSGVHAFHDELRPPNMEDPEIPDFTGNSGLKVPLSDTICVDFFRLYLTDDILDMFVKETNLYAKQTTEAARQRAGGLTKYGRFAAWYDTDREEMKQFIAPMLLMLSLIHI